MLSLAVGTICGCIHSQETAKSQLIVTEVGDLHLQGLQTGSMYRVVLDVVENVVIVVVVLATKQ